MRLILLVIIMLVLADSAYSRSPFDTDYVYTNSELGMDGKPTVHKVIQWVSGRTAKTSVIVHVRTCVELKKEDLRIKFAQQGPKNHIAVQSIVPITTCESPNVQKFRLYTSRIPAIELADIRVNKKKLVLWVYSNRAPEGAGLIN